MEVFTRDAVMFIARRAFAMGTLASKDLYAGHFGGDLRERAMKHMGTIEAESPDSLIGVNELIDALISSEFTRREDYDA